eukprot:8038406-Pyramimonas_sp.AAC.1
MRRTPGSLMIGIRDSWAPSTSLWKHVTFVIIAHLQFLLSIPTPVVPARAAFASHEHENPMVCTKGWTPYLL